MCSMCLGCGGRQVAGGKGDSLGNHTSSLFFFEFLLILKVDLPFLVSLVTQSCLTLCDLMDCRPTGSFVRGVLQARMLEWVAIPFSRGSSQFRDRN